MSMPVVVSDRGIPVVPVTSKAPSATVAPRGVPVVIVEQRGIPLIIEGLPE